jgi:hypothetical protein
VWPSSGALSRLEFPILDDEFPFFMWISMTLRFKIAPALTLFALCSVNQAIHAQTPVKLTGDGAAPYSVSGKQVGEIKSKSGDSIQWYMDFSIQAKSYVLTEVTREKDGTLNALTVYRVPVGRLAPLKDGAGSEVDVEDNDYFGGKVATLTLVCAGANQACIEEERVDTETGKTEAKKMSTFAKAHFPAKAEADAKGLLAEMLTAK